MRTKITSVIALAMAAAVLPGAMHASTTTSPASASAAFFGLDSLSAISAVTSNASPNPLPLLCDPLDPAGCGIIGGTGCTDSPENSTVLLGILGVSGLLVGHKTRSILQRRQTVAVAA